MMSATYGPLENWQFLPWPGTWAEQPAWWCEAAIVCRNTLDAIDREEEEERRAMSTSA